MAEHGGGDDVISDDSLSRPWLVVAGGEEGETLGDVGGNTNFQRNTVGASQSTVIDEATIINSQHAGTEYVSS